MLRNKILAPLILKKILNTADSTQRGMGISIGILLGFVAMIGWGISDFFVAKAVRKGPIFKTFAWSQIIGISIYFLIFAALFEFPIISFKTFGFILLTGFFGIILYLTFYKAMKIGYVSIISPLTASGVIITVLLSTILLNESLTQAQTIGVGFAILGAVLTSFKFHDLIKLNLKNLAVGVEYAFAAMIALGVYLTLIDMLVEELNWFVALFLIKMVTVFCFLTYAGMVKIKMTFPKKVWIFIILIGIFEAIGTLSYMAGISTEHTAVIAPIIATSPMITILLARIFFKEILDLNQKYGIAFVLMGLVLLAL